MFSQTLRASRRTFSAALACAAVLFSASAVRAEETGAYTCPVLHNPIDKVTKETQFSDFKGVRYYYCCDGCKPQFDKNPDKYLTDLDARVKAAQEKKATEAPSKDTK